MNHVRDFFRKIKDWVMGSRKHKIITAVICILVVGALVTEIVISAVSSGNEEAVTYRETKAEKGELTVGVEEDGTIAVGTSTQTFDIDLSAYASSSDSSDFSWSNGGAMGGGMGGDSQSSSGSTTASGTRQLQVQEVYASVGQNVSKGDKLMKLTESSVNTIRTDLEQEVNNALLTYNKQKTQQTLSDLEDSQTLETNKSYGSYAQTQLTVTQQQLQDAVDDAQKTLDDANSDMTDLQDELTEMQSHVTTYAKLQENAKFSKDGTDKENEIYWWLTAASAYESATDMVDTLSDNIDKQEDLIKAQQQEIDKDTTALNDAQKAFDVGQITAQAEYDKDMLDYDNAQELYDTGTGQTALTTDEAKDDYSDAQSKLDDFDDTVKEQIIYSDYDGVITAVGPAADDYIGTDSELITVNDLDKATVTVSVDEDDMTDIAEGSSANVYCPALPDETFTAEVTEIGDASYDTQTKTTTHEVTVTLDAETKSLFAGMTVEVTFITKQTKDVTYISNRAVIRDDGVSYVLMKDDSGKVVKNEITTGFSDGNNVEVKSGLTEGDTVLIESKASTTQECGVS